jgi:hypothetical protein
MRGILISSLGLVISLAGYQAYTLMMGDGDGTYYYAEEAFDPSYMPTVIIIGLGVLITVIGIGYYINDKEEKTKNRKATEVK